jgi:uncharacterized membrane protein YeaQ/YmgE (transglycosylase-associated protein family)
MGLFSWILLGLVAGALTKAIHPGQHEPLGALGTFAVGVWGAMFGGTLAVAVGLGSLNSFFSPGAWLAALAAGLLLLALYSAVADLTRAAAEEELRARQRRLAAR